MEIQTKNKSYQCNCEFAQDTHISPTEISTIVIQATPEITNKKQAVQKLLVGDTQTGDLISPLSFLESRVKMTGKWRKKV
jgi:hypothetical protein